MVAMHPTTNHSLCTAAELAISVPQARLLRYELYHVYTAVTATPYCCAINKDGAPWSLWIVGSVPDSLGIGSLFLREDFIMMVMTQSGKEGDSQARQTRKY